MKACIVSYKSSKEFIEILNKHKIEVIKTIPLKEVDKPIIDHPDMAIHPIDYYTFVVYNKHAKYYKEKLMKFNVRVVESYNNINKIFPNDIALNISRTKDFYFHKKGYTDKNVIHYLMDKSRPIYTNQGYSKCSSLIIKQNVIITCDKGLYNTYIKNGIKAYFLPQGSIDLPGYNTGFIGGCGGMISKNEILFYGNLDKYKYREELIEILTRENITYYYPSDCDFVDRGSIIGVLGGIND
ncbi:MAG: hypothetical protein Q4E02_03365 [Lagierella massiliensis]|nr:hypothetical protein [Lagierella massiliensis]